MSTTEAPKPLPVARQSPTERCAHVIRRAAERGNLTVTPELFSFIESRIAFVRKQTSEGKKPISLHPLFLGQDKMRKVCHYRVLVCGQPHTFVWSKIASGLISYRGPGLVLPKISPPKARKSKVNQVKGITIT